MPDWLKDMWISILDIWLPSKWPRLVATTTMGLEIGILTLSTWGPKFGLTPTEPQVSIIRTVGSPWLFFFSLFLIHYLVVREKNSYISLLPWIFHEKVTLTVGEYQEIKTNSNLLIKISCKEIRKEKMPPPCMCIPQSDTLKSFYDVDTEVAIISIIPQFVCPGPAVKRLEVSPTSNEESFAMGQWQDSGEYSSLFFFNIENSQKGPRFFRCFVNHINPNKQQVELSVFYLWMKK